MRRGAFIFALAFGLVSTGVLLLVAKPLGRLFSSDPTVVDVLARYIYITCFGYGFLEVHRYATFCMTGIHRPMMAIILNAIRVLVLMIPLAFLGAKWFGLSGVFWGRLLTDLLAAGIGVVWSGKILKKMIPE